MDILGLFVEGILSFLSPCVLPLVPLYMSYLSSNQSDNKKTPRVFLMTVFFVLGISVIFILLACSIDFIKPLIEDYSTYISLVGGFIIIAFGLHETGLINIDLLNSEKRITTNIDTNKMTYFKAFVLGFVFSFAWSPCIGPMLASAILIASTSSAGSIYILVYALGLVIPFLITGLFTSFVLNFIKEKKHILKYVMIVAGIIMIAYGVYMVANSIKDLSTITIKQETKEEVKTEYYVDDYEFTNQNDETIRLTDYKGKYIFLNFTTTWCTYCKQEIPDYLEFAKSGDEYVCFYVMSSKTNRVEKEEILNYIDENLIDIDVIFDEESILPSTNSYPMLYIVGKDGKYLGYVAGAINLERFNEILELAKNQD